MVPSAASVADGVLVDLRDVLCGLDRANLALVAAAVWHAGGEGAAAIRAVGAVG